MSWNICESFTEKNWKCEIGSGNPNNTSNQAHTYCELLLSTIALDSVGHFYLKKRW